MEESRISISKTAKQSILTKYFFPIGFAIAGFGTGIVSNYYARRPYYAGIQRHIGLGIVGLMFGIYVDKYLEKRWSERDAIIRHYIELHPEDFQENRRKYKEVFDEWYPMR